MNLVTETLYKPNNWAHEITFPKLVLKNFILNDNSF